MDLHCGSLFPLYTQGISNFTRSSSSSPPTITLRLISCSLVPHRSLLCNSPNSSPNSRPLSNSLSRARLFLSTESHNQQPSMSLHSTPHAPPRASFSLTSKPKSLHPIHLRSPSLLQQHPPAPIHSILDPYPPHPQSPPFSPSMHHHSIPTPRNPNSPSHSNHSSRSTPSLQPSHSKTNNKISRNFSPRLHSNYTRRSQCHP